MHLLLRACARHRPFFCEQTFLFEGVLSDSIDATLQSEGDCKESKEKTHTNTDRYYVCMFCKKGFDRKQDKEDKDGKTGFCPKCGREMKTVLYFVWR